MPAAYFHIGYPKSASTFMQRHVFARSGELNFYNYDDEVGNLIAVRPGSTRVSNFTEDERRAGLIRFVDEAERIGKTVVVSHESICLGNWMLTYDYIEESEVIYDRINGLLPNARIIVCFRPQFGWIGSWWRQHIKGHSTLSLPQFVETELWTQRILPKLRYDEVLRDLWSRFGKERVDVIFFQDLIRSETDFITNLCKLLGIEVPLSSPKPENKGLSQGLTLAKLHANRAYVTFADRFIKDAAKRGQLDRAYDRLWKRYLYQLDPLVPHIVKKRSIPTALRSELEMQFEESNKYLGEMMGIDISEKGFNISARR